jgi:hypothetical protein
MQQAANSGQLDETAASAKDGGRRPFNWRQRKKLVARRRELLDSYVQALGGPGRVGPILMAEVQRAVDMTQMAERMRKRALQGEAIDVGELVRLEGAVSRVIRSLNLPAANAAAPPAQTWQDFLAGHAASDGAEG